MTLYHLGEAFLLNPNVSLRRGTFAPFVSMASVTPFTRDVRTDDCKAYSGGAKFCDGDVLMARITPSLENGKTSIYRASVDAKDAPGFGSTEFIVVRGRDGVSDSTFAYYLFTSAEVRDHAISSMNGSSGRQRVQQDSLASLEVDLPSLPEQKAIASTLGALDDKIDSNRKQMQILRELGLARYIFAIEGDGAYAVPLANLTESITRGVTPKYADGDLTAPTVLNQKCIRDGWVSLAPARRMRDRTVTPSKKAKAGDILVNSTGTGTLGRLARWQGESIFVDGHVSIVRPDTSVVYPTVLAYSLLDREAEIEDLATGSTGQTELSSERLGSLLIQLPEEQVAAELEDLLLGFETRAAQLSAENDRLERLRDALVPELLSGRIRVPVGGVAA